MPIGLPGPTYLAQLGQLPLLAITTFGFCLIGQTFPEFSRLRQLTANNLLLIGRNFYQPDAAPFILQYHQRQSYAVVA